MHLLHQFRILSFSSLQINWCSLYRLFTHFHVFFNRSIIILYSILHMFICLCNGNHSVTFMYWSLIHASRTQQFFIFEAEKSGNIVMLQTFLGFFRAIEFSVYLNWIRYLFTEVLYKLSHLRTRKNNLYIVFVCLI